MTRYYSDEEEQYDEVAEQQLRDKEFDEKWDRMQKEQQEFEDSAPFGLFNCMDGTQYENVMTGSYKPRKNYWKPEPKNDFIFPEPFNYIPHEKTEEEIIEEKKGWVVLTKDGPKPLYPELFKLPTPEPTPPPPPKTKLEEIVETKKEKVKRTGNPWGRQETKSIDMNQAMEKARKDMEVKAEESRLKSIKDARKKKEQEEREAKRAEDRKRREERKQYFREKSDREQNDRREKRKNTGGSGRFANLF